MTVSNAALVRAADAMLYALGGNEVVVLFPLIGMPNDPSAQLGLVDPGVQQVIFSPVVVRSLTDPSSGPRRRLEFMISSTAVAAAVVSQNSASAEALFESALGLVYDNDLFHIVDVITEYFSGMPYLYRLTAVE
jgi:hypothetical protein